MGITVTSATVNNEKFKPITINLTITIPTAVDLGKLSKEFEALDGNVYGNEIDDELPMLTKIVGEIEKQLK